MSKDFVPWCSKKSAIHSDKIRPHFHEKEVWFVSLGANIGFEQDGKGDRYLRPVLVIKKFNSEVLWVIPTTSKNKEGKYYYKFSQGRDSSVTAILSQLRLIDSKRLLYKIGNAQDLEFNEIKERIISFLR